MKSERVQKKGCQRNYNRNAKRMVKKLFLTVCMIALLAMGGSAILTKATTPEDAGKVYYKYYTQIEIQEGDSLWTLAGKYMKNGPYTSRKEYMKEVVELNQLSNVTIIQGQHLVVPYYEDVYK